MDSFLIQLFEIFPNLLCHVPVQSQGTRPKAAPPSLGALTDAAHHVDVAVAVSSKHLSSLRMANFLWLGKNQHPVSRVARNHPAVLALSIFLPLSLSICLNTIYIL